LDIVWTKTATRDLRRLSHDARRRVFAKVAQCAADPAALAANVKALRGSDRFRLRVGDYRVIYRIEDDTVTIMVVLTVRHRSHAYD
jgi:mRNA interferase RelE/StbE